MRITFRDTLGNNTVGETSGFTLTAKFWDDSAEPWTANTPTTVKWRVDCLTTGYVMSDWTSVTPGTSVSLAVAGTINVINDSLEDREKRQVTVKANDGLATQYLDTYTYYVENNDAL